MLRPSNNHGTRAGTISADSRMAKGVSLMLRIDGFYLYHVGYMLHPLSQVSHDTTFQDLYLDLLRAEGVLAPLLHGSVFNLRSSMQFGTRCLSVIQAQKHEAENEDLKLNEIGYVNAYNLQTAVANFEVALQSELNMVDLYLVTKRRGFDTFDLIENGDVLFPEDLAKKVPEAIPDVKQGARCLAFELPTASGFHLHRANEFVLRRYFDAVSNGAERPNSRNMGDFLNQMRSLGVGEAVVLSALKDLKDLHRNPLVHPEHSLETVDDAIALLGSIRGVVIHMLKRIPKSNSSLLPQKAVPFPASVAASTRSS